MSPIVADDGVMDTNDLRLRYPPTRRALPSAHLPGSPGRASQAWATVLLVASTTLTKARRSVRDLITATQLSPDAEQVLARDAGART